MNTAQNPFVNWGLTVLASLIVGTGSLLVLALWLWATSETVAWFILRWKLWDELVAFIRWRQDPRRQLEKEIATRNAEKKIGAELEELREARSRAAHARSKIDWALGDLADEELSTDEFEDTLNRLREASALLADPEPERKTAS